MREEIGDRGIKFAILDGASQFAAFSEISRPLVTRAIQELTGLCEEFGAGKLMLGHNNRQGDFSGSSAWENRVRSRLHLKRERGEDGERTTISRPKANYAATEEGVELKWRDGAFGCVDQRFETGADVLDRKAREGAAEQAFLDGLDKMTLQQRAMSDSAKAGSSYAPKMIVASGLNAGPAPRGNLDAANGFCKPFTVKELEGAMNRLFRDNRIVANADLWRRSNRHQVTGIARKT